MCRLNIAPGLGMLRQRLDVRRLVALATITWAGCLAAAAQGGTELTPVKIVAPVRLAVTTPQGTGQFPLFVSADWTVPRPDIRRAVVIFHGILRNADIYYRDGLAALAAAGSDGAGAMIIAPQFLADFDVTAHKLSPDTLAWNQQDWPAGSPSLTTAQASSYDAIDAILAKLADRALFPHLDVVVIAGHSGGGQVVQRYAVASKGDHVLSDAGIKLRYVVANPSSYVYFVPERPDSSGKLIPFAGAATCPNYNQWRYGFAGNLPPYVSETPDILEKRYLAREVIHLLGSDDTDPNHRVLDKSCAGKAQGPHRYFRGHAYFEGMRARHGEAYRHRLFDIHGVGHQGGRMFGSACGLYALFDKPGCAD